MPEISATDTFAALGLNPNTSQKRANDELGQEQFLKLMVTQLQNQDPFKPMENGDFLGQIAQFGTVSGIQDLQDSFSQLAGTMQSSQVLEASSLVGRTVSVPTDQGDLGASGAVYGSIDLPVSATNVIVSVLDSSGALVDRMDLGTQQAGNIKFDWQGISEDGDSVANGLYTFKAEANSGAETFALATYIEAPVESVTFNGSGSAPVLNLTGIGRFDFSAVREVR